MQSGALKLNVNQKRHTNVAVVRIKRRGQRFELACYRNKVLSWRDGVETDLDEVLQTHEIFSNVSKGIFAKKEDIRTAFQTDDEDKIVREILEKGELQVSDKERQVQQESLFREIAILISHMCVDSTTNRPMVLGVLERAMRDAHISVVSNRSAKQQALEIIKLLVDRGIPIARAQMRIRVSFPSSNTDAEAFITPLFYHIESIEIVGVITGRIDPGKFRQVDEALRYMHGSVEVLNIRVFEEGTTAITLNSGDSATTSSGKPPVEMGKVEGKKKGRRRRKGKKGKNEESIDDVFEEENEKKVKKEEERRRKDKEEKEKEEEERRKEKEKEEEEDGESESDVGCTISNPFAMLSEKDE